ncbi:MAG: hypothetical protein GF344_06535 [Chitinivibrionales bacterium]|nr:hypothetical protein [Chitinivibrionales bacterium]MBD3356583.1 hypothetical protein [Chitinivibrionales bacterium]
MTRNQNIALVSFFLLVIYGVGIVQAIVEINKNLQTENRRRPAVQFFDVFADIFVTPHRRADKIAALFDKLQAKLDTVEAEIDRGVKARAPAVNLSAGDAAGEDADRAEDWDYYDAEMVIEEALFLADDIRREVMNVNRHVRVDTSGEDAKEMANPLFMLVDNLVEPVEKKYERVAALHAELKELYESAANEAALDELKAEFKEVRATTSRLEKKFPAPGPAKAPVLALQSFVRYTAFSRQYLRAYESEIEETSVFANALRPPMQYLRYVLLGDVGPKAVRGEKGWLFYKPGYEYLVRPHVTESRSRPKVGGSVVVDYTGNVVRDAVVDTIVSFQEKLRKQGVDLLVVIVPGKPSIYPDLLNPSISPDMAGKISHSVQFIRELRDAGVNAVDLFGPFAEARKIDPEVGDSLYLATDTHWRPRGLQLAAKVVADRVKQYPWYRPSTVEFMIDTVSVQREGDVGVMTTLPGFEVRNLTMKFPLEPTTCYQVSHVRRDPAGTILAKRLYHTMKGQYARTSEILLIGDSFTRIYQEDAPFSAGWVAHLAHELQKPVGYHYNDGGASTLVREWLVRKKGLLRNKKLVIWEFVERDLRFGAQGWKDLEL